jgi:hypothetical protein
VSRLVLGVTGHRLAQQKSGGSNDTVNGWGAFRGNRLPKVGGDQVRNDGRGNAEIAEHGEIGSWQRSV